MAGVTTAGPSTARVQPEPAAQRSPRTPRSFMARSFFSKAARARASNSTKKTASRVVGAWGSHRRSAHGYASNLIALALNGFTGAAPDDARQSAAQLQIVVGGVDHGVHVHFGQVALLENDFVHETHAPEIIADGAKLRERLSMSTQPSRSTSGNDCREFGRKDIVLPFQLGDKFFSVHGKFIPVRAAARRAGGSSAASRPGQWRS